MRAYLEVDLDKLEENIKKISEKVDKNKIMAVIKANAYGHGLEKVFEKLKSIGIDYFAVATLNEAMRLYNIDKFANILILGIVEKEKYKDIENTNIRISVSNEKELEYILKNKLKNKIHIKFNTGMNRLGFTENTLEIIDKYLKTLNIEGIFTHLSSIYSNTEYTENQINIFKEYTKKYDLKKHILSSAGLQKYYKEKDIVLDYVRVGIDLYTNVLGFYARVCNVYRLEKDEYIGYDMTYKAQKNSYIATISIGYADGYKRDFSNKGIVFIKGKEYKVVGNVCMDLIMVEVDENVNVGDIAELYGNNISIKKMAELIGTIDYELMSTIGDRVPRIYKGK
ncbi:alanine racemase [Oceanivirga salmonicida]|uniref:alanine racemase n=1 Tax=Oceanivirga salmonicida TaxID=1769291 RepID=UPI00083249A6|nr:alanine racemase [Oceanivirga salmonicida]